LLSAAKFKTLEHSFYTPVKLSAQYGSQDKLANKFMKQARSITNRNRADSQTNRNS
jgi:hypothetical protein